VTNKPSLAVHEYRIEALETRAEKVGQTLTDVSAAEHSIRTDIASQGEFAQRLNGLVDLQQSTILSLRVTLFRTFLLVLIPAAALFSISVGVFLVLVMKQSDRLARYPIAWLVTHGAVLGTVFFAFSVVFGVQRHGSSDLTPFGKFCNRRTSKGVVASFLFSMFYTIVTIAFAPSNDAGSSKIVRDLIIKPQKGAGRPNSTTPVIPKSFKQSKA
jgi:hypothetical protein